MLPGHVTFFQPLCSPHFLSSYNLCTSISTYQESSFFCIFFLKTVTVVILHFCCCCSYSMSPLLKWKLREVRVCLCSSPYLLPLHTVLVQWPVQRIFNYYIQLHSVCLSLNTSQTKMLLIPQNTTPLTELPCCRIQGMMARVSKGMMACLITSCAPDIGLSIWIVCSEVECYSSWLQVTVTLFFHQAKNFTSVFDSSFTLTPHNYFTRRFYWLCLQIISAPFTFPTTPTPAWTTIITAIDLFGLLAASLVHDCLLTTEELRTL